MLTRLAPVTLAVLVAYMTVPAIAVAQIGIPRGAEGPFVQLEIMKPSFEDQGFGPGFGFATAIVDATVAVPIGGGPTLFGRLGLSHASMEGFSSTTMLSNPRFGALFGAPGTTQVEVHIDLALAKEFGDDSGPSLVGAGAIVAAAADYERLERFLLDAWSLGASVTPETTLGSGGVLGGRFGVTAVVPTEDDLETELLGSYGGFAYFPAGSARLGGELSGIAVLSEDDGDFNDRTTFFVTLSASMPDLGPAPELYMRFPLDEEISEYLSFVLGLRVRFGG